jgi:hypothetical protein
MKEEDVEEGQYLRALNSAEEEKEGHQCPEWWGEQLNGHQWPGNSGSVILRWLDDSSCTATE